MSRLPRAISKSGVYHVLFRGINQQNIFEENEDYLKLKETIINVKEDMSFEIYAYCFMTNHVHIVLKEKNMGDISLIMKRILTKYVRWYNVKYGRSGALIANRYKSVPVEIDEYFLNLIRYIHQNPVKAGVSDDVEDYHYSSFTEYTNNSYLTDIDLLLDMISLDEFISFHQEPEDMNFNVTDSRRKSDEDVIKLIKKQYNIDNPQSISKLSKIERNNILKELKSNFSARQLQRITGISRVAIRNAWKISG